VSGGANGNCGPTETRLVLEPYPPTGSTVNSCRNHVKPNICRIGTLMTARYNGCTRAEDRATTHEQLERRAGAEARAEGLALNDVPLLFALCSGFG